MIRPLAAVALLVLFVAIRLFSGGGASAPPVADGGGRLTPEEMKALGIEGDTPRVNTVLTYGEVPDMKLNDLTSLLFYGRTSP